MPKVKLTIEWGGPGTAVQVHGPIADKLLCFGLLEMAKDAVRDYVATHQSAIVVPRVTVPADLKPTNGEI